MMQGFEGADLVFFVGYHARTGKEGVLSHTFDSPPSSRRSRLTASRAARRA
jgi:D-aminopeptidase